MMRNMCMATFCCKCLKENLIKRSRVLWLAERLVHEFELELTWTTAHDEVTARLIKEVTLLIDVGFITCQSCCC